MLERLLRRAAWRRRVDAAHEWRDEQRAQHDSAIARILAQATDLPDPCSKRARRSA